MSPFLSCLPSFRPSVSPVDVADREYVFVEGRNLREATSPPGLSSAPISPQDRTFLSRLVHGRQSAAALLPAPHEASAPVLTPVPINLALRKPHALRRFLQCLGVCVSARSD